MFLIDALIAVAIGFGIGRLVRASRRSRARRQYQVPPPPRDGWAQLDELRRDREGR